jgi:hypothetical protein
MKFSQLVIFLFSIFFCWPFLSLAQKSNNLDYFPQQKVYVHFDKDFYVLGEKIWMKAFLLEDSPVPDSLKRNVFVDIVNAEGKVINHLIFKTEGNGAEGSFDIPTAWNEGVYFIQAYTPYLMAFGVNAFYKKDIPIYSSSPESAWIFKDDNPVQKTKLDLQFFPEGGHLIHGIESKVAFLAKNENGKGIGLQGFIKNNLDSIVLHFESNNLSDSNKAQGLGYFLFKPDAGQTYQVFVKINTGETYSFSLPTIMNQGYTLKVEDADSENFTIKIHNGGIQTTEVLKIKVSQNARELLQLNTQITSEQTFTQLQLSKNKLTEGLLLIQLLADNKILAERICFNLPKNKNGFNIQNTETKFRLRQNINLALIGEFADNQSIKNNFTLLVRKKAPQISFENITSYYWLSSTLANPIENSAYYLSNETKAKQDLDVLLITQKLKPFTTSPDFFKTDYNLNVLKCIAKDSITHTPIPRISIGVFSYETQKAYNSFSDSKGFFQINISDDVDQQTLFFFNTEKSDYINPPIEVEIARYNPSSYPVTPKQLTKSKEIQQYLLDFNKRRLIENNFSPKDTSNNKQEKTRNLLLKPTQTVILAEYVDFADVKELLKEVTYNITNREKNGVTKIRMLTDKKPNFKMTFPPFYIINGQPTRNHNIMYNLPIGEIKKMDLYANYRDLIRYYNKFGGGGFLAFETYKDNINLKNTINVNTLQFFNQVDKFVAPIFTSSEASLPFFSPLIVWQPNLSSLNNGISFYHTDDIGDFEVILEGINAEGKPVQAYFEYKVGIGK